jgi:hypothetical protein
MDNLMFPIKVPMKYPSHDELFRDEKFKSKINEHNAKMARFPNHTKGGKT